MGNLPGTDDHPAERFRLEGQAEAVVPGASRHEKIAPLLFCKVSVRNSA
jgi:hypothetical protein